MKKSSIAVATAISAMAFASAAYAADNDQAKPMTSSIDPGWYGSVSAGMAFMDSAHSHSGSSVFDLQGDNPGYDVTGAVGKELGHGFRAEGELGYHHIDMDHATVYSPGALGVSSGHAGGDASAFSVMGNGYYDFDTGTRWKPYLGGGLGFANVNFSGIGINGRPVTDDNDLAFAYQAMAGVGYQLTPRGTLFAGYRYFAVDDPTFDDASGGKLHSEFATHNVELGYRLSF
jgi:opacity protein-like surface antigen